MIGFLRGEVLEHEEGRILVLASGVGYLVAVPSGAAYSAFLPGKPVDLFIYTHVREDALDLFGFASRSEKELFTALLTVNGVGPKLAMGLLSRAGESELVRAVVENDKDALTRIPGIGKKTAERVVLELGDKLRKKLETGELKLRGGAQTATRASGGAVFKPGVLQDAREALVSLGYRDQDITGLLQRIVSELESPPRHAEELVKTALRQLSF